MSNREIATLQRKAYAACNRYQAALVRQYGRQACNARYDERGEATPELRELAKAKIEAFAEFRTAAFGKGGEA